MDDKTEELRDLFLDVTDEQTTVTESQEEGRGSLTDDGRPVDERLQSVVGQMQEKFTFETDWDTETYCDLVTGFYDGNDDAALASTLDKPPARVFWGRMDLHLLRDDDPVGATIEEPVLATISDRPDEAPAVLAADLDIPESTVERCRGVLDAQDRSRRVSQRFQTSFEEILTDADLTVQFATEAHDDGLDEATDGAEVDVDF
jgi:hypothetical protein